MTIREAIDKIDAIKPNQYTQEDKVSWLNSLDGRIKRNIIDRHEGYEDVEWNPYTEDTDVDTVLLADDVYADLYIHWLESKIDYCNHEYAKYNNSVVRFNEEYAEYERWYNRTHMPLATHHNYY